jgi:nicotinamidase-related amidase
MNALLAKATAENLPPAEKDKERVLLLVIDMQQDFMEKGSLAVPKSHGDVDRLCRWMHANMAKITKVAVSLDTHNPFAIFHPAWWIDAKGSNPPPFTPVSLKDLDDGKWMPVINPIESRDYVENLEKLAKKTLMIWTYHCLEGTAGHALENQFSNMVYFQSVAKKSIVERMVK